ncbi:MAG TPA: hypothetical protein VFL93_00190 [Longimicrobiaceae bacterium]|nr:hypothetical protein [Longimicrobiaceae bacterium]
MARYDRYDVSLRAERGQVISGMSPNYNDYRASYGYDRDLDPREVVYWRRPSDLRGDVRGGAAFTYGYGNDYDRVYRMPHNRLHTPHPMRDRVHAIRNPYFDRYDRIYDFARGYDLGRRYD